MVTAEDPTKRCPSCAEEVHQDAKVCKHCKRRIHVDGQFKFEAWMISVVLVALIMLWILGNLALMALDY